MSAGTGRQTAALYDWAACRIEKKMRSIIKGLAIACASLSVLILIGAVLIWTPITLPEFYAVSPQGSVHHLRPLEQ